MPSHPLFNEDDADEPELIPHRERQQSAFSKPFEIRVAWLVLIGLGLLIWQISLSDWRRWLNGSANLLWLGVLLPVAIAWWKLRRLGSRSRHRRAMRSSESSDDSISDADQIRLVAESEDDPAAWKLVGGVIGYVLAVLALIVIALWRMLG